MGGPGWRPITEEEGPALAAVGALVRGLRDEFALTQVGLGRLANVSASHISAIERGRRRTRRSTLERIVRALFTDEEQVGIRLQELVEAAGDALGDEEVEAQRKRLVQRLERRERRWGRKHLAEAIRIAEESERSLRRIVRMDEQARRTGPIVEHRVALLAKVIEDTAKMRQQQVELEGDAARRSRQAPLPQRPDKGPAWHALQEYARSLLPPGKTAGRLYPNAEQVERLAELQAAADAEGSD